jgi:hypothetical protein
MGPLIIMLLLPCPTMPEGDSTRLPKGCEAPVDGWLWTRPADAAREAKVAEQTSVIRNLELELTETETALDLCADGCDLSCPPIPPAPTASWVWATLGGGAPLAAVGVCSLAGCDFPQSLLSGILAGALTIGVAAW